MQEDFIDWIWQNRLYRQQDLVCESGESLQVLDPGIRNSHSGPDYFNARLVIDGVTWIGNVELHVKASDWLRHKHHRDAMYENVILHVVHEPDLVIYRKDGSRIPELSLRNRYPAQLLNQYLDLLQGTAQWIPCERLLEDVPELVLHHWLARVMSSRLEERTEHLDQLLIQTNSNWEEMFYRKVSEGFGFRVNKEPFAMLAANLPVNILKKNALQHKYCESLLFGQAGFLSGQLKDEYGKELFREYQHLQRLYQLTPLSAHIWKFGRLRPANFPTRRIAQLAALIRKTPFLFDAFLHATTLTELKTLFECEPEGYWKRHYHFDKEVPQTSAGIGEGSIENLIINSVIPFLFYYGKKRSDPEFAERALRLLEECRPENNAIHRNWERIGIKAGNALESQALLQLHKTYCTPKKCVTCGIGNYLLQQK